MTFEDMTVVENVMVGAFLRHPNRAGAMRKAEEMLAFTGLAHLAGSPAGRWGPPAASGWRSPGRWQRNRGCCCWTRRWPD